jgi:hypothetical protein
MPDVDLGLGWLIEEIRAADEEIETWSPGLRAETPISRAEEGYDDSSANEPPLRAAVNDDLDSPSRPAVST